MQLSAESKPEKADVPQEPPPNEWRIANLELAEFKERSKVFYICRSNPEIGVPEPWVATFNVSPDGLKLEFPFVLVDDPILLARLPPGVLPPIKLTAEDGTKALNLVLEKLPLSMAQAVIMGGRHPEEVEAMIKRHDELVEKCRWRKVKLAELTNLTVSSLTERNGKHFPVLSAVDVDLARRVVARYAPAKAEALESIFAIYLPLTESRDTSILGAEQDA
jgi:hypothetical protein